MQRGGIEEDQINKPDVVAEVTAVFEGYERALLANDAEVLIEMFWDSPLTVRYGIDEQHIGAEDIATYRRAQSAASPARDLRNTVITTFGDNFATADTEFVTREGGEVGRQSQTWVRTNGVWRVTSAHVSWRSQS